MNNKTLVVGKLNIEVTADTSAQTLANHINEMWDSVASTRFEIAKTVCIAIGVLPINEKGDFISETKAQSDFCDSLNVDKAIISRMVKAVKVAIERGIYEMLENGEITFSEEKLIYAFGAYKKNVSALEHYSKDSQKTLKKKYNDAKNSAKSDEDTPTDIETDTTVITLDNGEKYRVNTSALEKFLADSCVLISEETDTSDF